MADLKEMRTEISDAVTSLLVESGFPIESASDLLREVIGAFAFGMVFGFGNARGLQPPDVHALAVTTLMDSIGFESDQAGGLAQYLIDISGDKSIHPTLNVIIHRGIDGYSQWAGAGRRDAVKNLNEILAAVQESSTVR